MAGPAKTAAQRMPSGTGVPPSGTLSLPFAHATRQSPTTSQRIMLKLHPDTFIVSFDIGSPQ